MDAALARRAARKRWRKKVRRWYSRPTYSVPVDKEGSLRWDDLTPQPSTIAIQYDRSETTGELRTSYNFPARLVPKKTTKTGDDEI